MEIELEFEPAEFGAAEFVPPTAADAPAAAAFAALPFVGGTDGDTGNGGTFVLSTT